MDPIRGPGKRLAESFDFGEMQYIPSSSIFRNVNTGQNYGVTTLDRIVRHDGQAQQWNVYNHKANAFEPILRFDDRESIKQIDDPKELLKCLIGIESWGSYLATKSADVGIAVARQAVTGVVIGTVGAVVGTVIHSAMGHASGTVNAATHPAHHVPMIPLTHHRNLHSAHAATHLPPHVVPDMPVLPPHVAPDMRPPPPPQPQVFEVVHDVNVMPPVPGDPLGLIPRIRPAPPNALPPVLPPHPIPEGGIKVDVHGGVNADALHGASDGPFHPGDLRGPDQPDPIFVPMPHDAPPEWKDKALEVAQDGAFVVTGELCGQVVGAALGAAGGPGGVVAGKVIGGIIGAAVGWGVAQGFHAIF